MKAIFVLAFAPWALYVALQARAGFLPAKIPARYEKIYVPHGFDSNDQVQVVGEGNFRNSCYRYAETEVKVDQTRKQIHLSPFAYEYSGICLQVILPLERVIEIGILNAGSWDILQGHEQKAVGRLEVREATTPNADDDLYAPISQAFVTQHGRDGEILLSGEFTNSCLAIDRVLVKIQPDVIVVRPIAKMNDVGNCEQGRFPFQTSSPIQGAKPGRYLLHVRSMNGHAVNSLIDLH